METNLLSHKPQPLSPVLSQALTETPSQSELQSRSSGHASCTPKFPKMCILPATLSSALHRHFEARDAGLCMPNRSLPALRGQQQACTYSAFLMLALLFHLPYPEPVCYISTTNYMELLHLVTTFANYSSKESLLPAQLLRKLTEETEICTSRHFNQSDLNLKV